MAKSKRDLAHYGRWAVITGAAQGLGFEFARQLAQAGVHIIAIDHNEGSLRQAAETLREYDVEVIGELCDLTQPSQRQALMERLANYEVGVLINNAGISHIGPLLSQPLDYLQKQIDLHCSAVLELTYCLGQQMVERQCGAIILLSSGSALNGFANNANYSATKAYDLMLAESLWWELKPHGIDVLGFMPSSTNTPGFRRQSPMDGLLGVMPVEQAVSEAFNALGHRPSLFAGRCNRWLYNLMRSISSRANLIRVTSANLQGMFRRALDSET